MGVIVIASGVGAVLLLFGGLFLFGALSLPEPTVTYPADGEAKQSEFLETGRVTMEVPGRSIQIEGELVSMTCVNGTDLQGERCGWNELTADNREIFHPDTTLMIVGRIVGVEASYVSVMVGESAVYGIAEWPFWGDTTRAYRFSTSGGEYGAQLYQVVKKGFATREPYEQPE